MTPEEFSSRVSVIVPAYNAASTLGRCIDSILALSPPPQEVIVADDGSTDNTSEVALARGVKVVRLSRNSGPGLARNEGARIARGEFLAFTDSDCEVPKDWLLKYQTFAEDVRYCAATGPYLGTCVDGLIPRLMDSCLRFSQSAMPDEIESSISSNLFVRQTEFHALGGFPEYWIPGASKPCFTNEDQELAFLLCRATGKPVRWVGNNGPYHAYRPSLQGYLRQQAKYAESVLVSYARFPKMAFSSANYSRGGGLSRVVAAWLALSSVFLPSWAPIMSAPFLLLCWPAVRYVASCEKERRRRREVALCAYPFLFLTAIAWTKGLATGALKGLIGLITWHVLLAPSRGSPKA